MYKRQAFAVCRRPLGERYLTETVSGLGEVPVAPFALPSTREVPDSVRPFVRDHSAVLLANHGALAWGPDLWSAFDRMETVEQTARIYANVQLLGGGVELTGYGFPWDRAFEISMEIRLGAFTEPHKALLGIYYK